MELLNLETVTPLWLDQWQDCICCLDRKCKTLICSCCVGWDTSTTHGVNSNGIHSAFDVEHLLAVKN